MKFFKKCKDGGKNSPVDGYFLCEIKGLFSIALLKFNKGGREQFHTHAFDAYTWFLTGDLEEERLYEDGSHVFTKYTRKLLPKFTSKKNNHRVKANKDSWCLTIRGKWDDTWTEHDLNKGKVTTFTHGRNIVGESEL